LSRLQLWNLKGFYQKALTCFFMQGDGSLEISSMKVEISSRSFVVVFDSIKFLQVLTEGPKTDKEQNNIF
jgi:hypothetical protein